MNIYFLSKIYWGFGWLFRAWPRNSGFFYLVEILSNCASTGGFPSGSAIKNPPAMHEMQETWVRPLGQEDPLEEGMAKPTPVFSPGESHGQRSLMGPMDRRIPWTEKSMGSQRVGHNWATEHARASAIPTVPEKFAPASRVSIRKWQWSLLGTICWPGLSRCHLPPLPSTSAGNWTVENTTLPCTQKGKWGQAFRKRCMLSLSLPKASFGILIRAWKIDSPRFCMM